MDVIDDILLRKDGADATLFKETLIRTFPDVAEGNLRLALADFGPEDRVLLQKLFKLRISIPATKLLSDSHAKNL